MMDESGGIDVLTFVHNNIGEDVVGRVPIEDGVKAN